MPNVGIDPGGLVDLAVDAEKAGWDGVFVWDAIFGINPWVALTAMALRAYLDATRESLTPYD